MYFLPASIALLVAAAATPVARAGSTPKGGACSQSDNRLQPGTYQFFSDCDSETYCAQNGTCLLKGCRKDDFPFGYPPDSNVVPPKCGKGQFCPDEEDACLDVLPVGSPCQFQRDDQCQGPPNFLELRDTSSKGLNVNGSVCLNYQCMYANMTVGQTCAVENTAYIGYAPDGEFIDIVSRGNCKLGLYCDSQKLVCMQQQNLGATCEADKECVTFNCMSNGKCGLDASAADKIPIYGYILVAIAILGGIAATLIGFFHLHRRQRDVEREKRAQYWREQHAFRQNIMQMRETARQSVASLGNGSTLYSREGSGHGGGPGSEESHMPMLGTMRSSGLRHEYSDEGDGSDDGHITMDGRPGKF